MPAKGAMTTTAEVPVQPPLAAGAPAGVLVEEVERTYRTRRGDVAALRGLTLRVAANEIVAVVGPSGCGKSTLLELVCALQAPDAGRVEAGPAVYMPQRDLLLPWASALDNAALPLRVHGASRTEAHDRARPAWWPSCPSPSPGRARGPTARSWRCASRRCARCREERSDGRGAARPRAARGLGALRRSRRHRPVPAPGAQRRRRLAVDRPRSAVGQLHRHRRRSAAGHRGLPRGRGGSGRGHPPVEDATAGDPPPAGGVTDDPDRDRGAAARGLGWVRPGTAAGDRRPGLPLPRGGDG